MNELRMNFERDLRDLRGPSKQARAVSSFERFVAM
jgi:hypothetical protein